MTEIVPFRGIHYNSEKVSGEVVAPPYDIITPEYREELYAQSPYNVVRIDFGMKNPGDSEEDDKYTRANAYLTSWLNKGILKQSDKPIYYAYRMSFTLRGKQHSLTGLFGLTRLVDLGKGVYPHEATHSKPKKDRLSLMLSSSSNTSPIYSIYKTEKGSTIKEIISKTISADPYMQATDPDETTHSLWIIDDEAEVAAVKDALDGVDVFIADGHHRYETALEYKRMMDEKAGGATGTAPHDYVMMFVADMDDPELIALPTHRLITVDVDTMVEKLSDNFEVKEIEPDADIPATIEGMKHTFGMYAGGKRYCITCKHCALDHVDAKLKELDVVVLHKLIFGKLLEVGNWDYEMLYDTTLEMVDEGEYDAAFFLNPTAITDVERVARAGLRMPPKSTYFYPKIQTGFVINSLK